MSLSITDRTIVLFREKPSERDFPRHRRKWFQWLVEGVREAFLRRLILMGQGLRVRFWLD